MTQPPHSTISLDEPVELDGILYRRADREPFFPREWDKIFVASPKPRKPPKPTLDSVVKSARKAGIDVARYELKPDGTVVVVIGKPEPVEPGAWPLDEFRAKETKQ